MVGPLSTHVWIRESEKLKFTASHYFVQEDYLYTESLYPDSLFYLHYFRYRYILPLHSNGGEIRYTQHTTDNLEVIKNP